MTSNIHKIIGLNGLRMSKFVPIFSKGFPMLYCLDSGCSISRSHAQIRWHISRMCTDDRNGEKSLHPRVTVYISMIILHLDKSDLLHRFEPWFSILQVTLGGGTFTNVDASLFASRTMGIGVVIQNVCAPELAEVSSKYHCSAGMILKNITLGTDYMWVVERIK